MFFPPAAHFLPLSLSLAVPQVSFPICPLEEYNADATTKQNILCDGRGARRVILDSAAAAAAESLRKSDNGTSLEGGEADQMEDKETEPLRFEYLLPSKPQLFVLVLDRSSLPAAIEEGTGKEHYIPLRYCFLEGVPYVCNAVQVPRP